MDYSGPVCSLFLFRCDAISSWNVIGGFVDELSVESFAVLYLARFVIGISRWIRRANRLRPAADAGGDGFLGGGLLLPDALRRGLDAVRGLERLDLLGEFGNARPFFVAWLMGRRRKARP